MSSSNEYIKISVCDPFRLQDNLGSYISYKVITQSNIRNLFQDSEVSVLRRYRDFKWLYDELCRTSGGVIVPAIPEKQIIGNLSAAFVESRRRALEKFLTRCATHPDLRKSEYFLSFLREDDDSFNRTKATVKASKGNVATAAKSWFENAVNTFQNSGKSEVDSSPTDVKVDEIQANINSLERLIQSIHKGSENLVKRSRELSTTLFDFGQSITWLGQSEGNDFGSVITRIGTATSDMSVTATSNAETEAIELEEPLDEYVRLINSVKNAIKHRQHKKEIYREALTDLEVKQAAYNKLRVSGKTDQLEAKRQQVEISQANVEKIKKEFEDISDKFLLEYNNFMETTAIEIKQILLNYAKLQVEYNRKLEKAWGELLPIAVSK